jgi:hypothetical protein
LAQELDNDGVVLLVLNTTAPHPSPRAYPSASAENVAHRPRGDSIRAALNATQLSMHKFRFTPATMACTQSPLANALLAASNATNDDEHAVSIVIDGPSRPNTYAKRFDAIDDAIPLPS